MSAQPTIDAARIAAAPISWGVCEAPGWGEQLPADQVLDELRTAGYAATEAGPDDYLPSRTVELWRTLDRHGLELAGAFVPVTLHDRLAREHSRAGFASVLDRIAGSSRTVAVLAVLGARADYEAREELTDDEWRSTLRGLRDLADRATSRGVACVVHPHVGTVVEQREDVDRILDGTDIPFCLDTGHLLLGGVDPLELARDAPDRIGHVHLKDVDLGHAERWRAGESPSYHSSVADGMYTAIGSGGARVGEVVDELARANYRGWYVLERDTVIEAGTDATATDAREARVANARADREWVLDRIAAARTTTEVGR